MAWATGMAGAQASSSRHDGQAHPPGHHHAQQHTGEEPARDGVTAEDAVTLRR